MFKDNRKWRSKCDSLITAEYKGRPCEVCLSGGVTRTFNTWPHHAVEKSRSARFRCDRANIIILCPDHHTGGAQIAAHAGGPARQRFTDWVKRHRPEAYRIMESYKQFIAEQIDFNAVFRKLTGR